MTSSLPDLLINSSATHSLLLVLPIASALLLRWARCPGWPVVGGAVAGILLGPAILGRLAPETFERHFVGAITQREARDALVREQQRERLVAREAGFDAASLAAMNERHLAARAAAEAELADTRWAFQRPFRSYTTAIVTLTLLGSGLLRVRGGGRPRQGLVAPASIGLWSAAAPGAAAAMAMVWWWGYGPVEAAMTAAAVAVGPAVLSHADREAADRAEIGGARMIQTAGRFASVVALAVAVWAMAEHRGVEGLLWSASLLALPVGWVLPAPRAGRILRGALDVALVPTLTACVALRVEIIEHFAFWPLLVIVILSGDGRWLGALVGALLPGRRRPLRTMRLVLGSMSCGSSQLALAAVAAHTWALPGPILLALLAGAAVIEATTPARRVMAERLEEEGLRD